MCEGGGRGGERGGRAFYYLSAGAGTVWGRVLLISRVVDFVVFITAVPITKLFALVDSTIYIIFYF
jgi:hypothetical protein